MKLTTLTISAALAISLVIGCSKDERAQSPENTNATTTPPPGAEAPHAAAAAEPGSHEDWCGEHAVPESQCTRCNPALIAAFKATGDWCEEHGMPESQCTACNPDLEITRPPKPADTE